MNRRLSLGAASLAAVVASPELPPNTRLQLATARGLPAWVGPNPLPR